MISTLSRFVLRSVVPGLCALSLPAMISSASEPSAPELRRVSYFSQAMQQERDYYVYLPRGFAQRDNWPVLLFLHGNGERGDGKAELPFVLKHGAPFEAWLQGRDLPFVIIAPQLPMYGMAGVDYIRDRKLGPMPESPFAEPRPMPPHYEGKDRMEGVLTENKLPQGPEGLRQGWPMIEHEVLAMVDRTLADFKGDPRRVYITGISYGGFGTWYLAAKHPEKFAAMAPVVGYGHPDHAPAIAAARLPVWVFAGGRDTAVPLKYFYPVLNRLEELGHPDVRFTIEGDMGHSAWERVYAGEDLYRWLLSKSK